MRCPTRCIAFDRSIDTDRAIPGALPDEGDNDAIPIRWHASVAREERPVWTRGADALWFDPPGVARYRCTADGIDVMPVVGADLDHVDALLIATALPALLWLQGDVVLHAAAIVPAGGTQALAIAGPSGSGKSHRAAALLARRARLVADDSIALRSGVCSGLASGYHLGSRGDENRPFHRVADGCRAAPLGTVIVLDDSPEPYARLSGVAAVQALLANRHRASVSRLCGLDGRALGTIADLARTARVFRASQHITAMQLDECVCNAMS